MAGAGAATKPSRRQVGPAGLLGTAGEVALAALGSTPPWMALLQAWLSAAPPHHRRGAACASCPRLPFPKQLAETGTPRGWSRAGGGLAVGFRGPGAFFSWPELWPGTPPKHPPAHESSARCPPSHRPAHGLPIDSSPTSGAHARCWLGWPERCWQGWPELSAGLQRLGLLPADAHAAQAPPANPGAAAWLLQLASQAWLDGAAELRPTSAAATLPFEAATFAWQAAHLLPTEAVAVVDVRIQLAASRSPAAATVVSPLSAADGPVQPVVLQALPTVAAAEVLPRVAAQALPLAAAGVLPPVVAQALPLAAAGVAPPVAWQALPLAADGVLPPVAWQAPSLAAAAGPQRHVALRALPTAAAGAPVALPTLPAETAAW